MRGHEPAGARDARGRPEGASHSWPRSPPVCVGFPDSPEGSKKRSSNSGLQYFYGVDSRTLRYMEAPWFCRDPFKRTSLSLPGHGRFMQGLLFWVEAQGLRGWFGSLVELGTPSGGPQSLDLKSLGAEKTGATLPPHSSHTSTVLYGASVITNILATLRI